MTSGKKSGRKRWGATNDSFDDWGSMDLNKSYGGGKKPAVSPPKPLVRNGSMALTSAATNKSGPKPLGQVNVNAMDKRAVGADEDDDDLLE